MPARSLIAAILVVLGVTVVPTSGQADPGADAASGDALAGVVKGLTERALKRTKRRPSDFGVTAGAFQGTAALAALPAGAGSGGPVHALLARLKDGKEQYRYSWSAGAKTFAAVFELSLEPPVRNLHVSLLWLELPDRVPIRPDVGPIGGLKPLADELAEALQTTGGHLTVPGSPN